jgi:hypothetical protein
MIEPFKKQIALVKGPYVFNPLRNGSRVFDTILRTAETAK